MRLLIPETCTDADYIPLELFVHVLYLYICMECAMLIHILWDDTSSILESFSLPFKRQTTSHGYDVTRLNLHELQKKILFS